MVESGEKKRINYGISLHVSFSIGGAGRGRGGQVGSDGKSRDHERGGKGHPRRRPPNVQCESRASSNGSYRKYKVGTHCRVPTHRVKTYQKTGIAYAWMFCRAVGPYAGPTL